MNRRELIIESAKMMGYTVSATTAASLLASCDGAFTETNSTEINSLEANRIETSRYEFFNNKQAEALILIGDIILPRTDTPSASDVDAFTFIDAFIKHVFTENKQKQFLVGLNAFDAYVREAAKGAFSKVHVSEQVKHVVALDELTYSANNNLRAQEQHFYRAFKSLVVLGYYQSEQLGETVLKYDPVPGIFKGCMDYEGKAWSLR